MALRAASRRGADAGGADADAGVPAADAPPLFPTQPLESSQFGVGATQRDDAGSRRLRQAIRSIAARAVGECEGKEEFSFLSFFFRA